MWRVSWPPATSAFERSSKRRKGFPSETRVKKGDRVVHGDKELIRETRPQRPVPVRLGALVSGIAAWAADGSTARRGSTIADEGKAASCRLFWALSEMPIDCVASCTQHHAATTPGACS
jgi:hypothetical protein